MGISDFNKQAKQIGMTGFYKKLRVSAISTFTKQVNKSCF
jgi:hypothetical protein